VTVNLASSNTAVSVPAAVKVPADATSAAFTATVAAVSVTQTATLTASDGSVSTTFAMQLNAATPKLTLSSNNLAFGNANLNIASSQAIQLSSSGTAALTINSATLVGTGFTVSGATFPVTLNPSQTVALQVQFDPTVSGAATGTLTISSNGSSGGTAVVSLTGTGVATLSALTCANSSVNGSGTDTCTVTLNGAAASAGLTVNLASNNTAVAVPATVTVPASTASAAFTASVTAVSTAQTATLTATSGGASNNYALQLKPGTPTMSVSSVSLAFGDVNVNSAATQSLTLTSSGTAPVTISAAASTGTGFSVSGVTFPVTLNPNQAATLEVGFDPTTTGSASGHVTISSNSSTGAATVVSLSGTGEAASYQADLSWDAPGGTIPVAGYNVYRAISGGSIYQLLNSSIDSQTAYNDSTVQNGVTYDYYVETVDTSGISSAPSTVFVLSIP
jgi:hypothetical protein